MKVDNLKFHWQHNNDTVELRKNRLGKPIYVLRGRSQCFVVRESQTPTILASVVFTHKDNHFDRKKGVYESFLLIMKKCPSKELRAKAWAEYWRVRKPTVTVSEDTAQLLRFLPYIGYELHKNIQKKNENNYNEGWQYLTPLEIAKEIGSRLFMYREKSEYSLIAIMRLCTIGFINFKNSKNARIQNQNSK